MKYLKYILAVLIVSIAPNVFALEVDVTSSITSPETSGTGKYRGTEILNTGTQATYNVRTRYQGRLSRIIYNLPLPSELGDCFTTNAIYTVTMYMETNDWNNKFGTVKVRPYSSSSTNWSNGNVTYVSYKKIYFTFKIPSSDTTCYDFVWVDLPSTNISNTGITQISNWNLNKITLTDPTISSGGSSGGSGTTPTPTPDNTQQIIDSQNENAQNIIENNNTNTQNIIENNNENTDKLNESLNSTCKDTQINLSYDYAMKTGAYLNSNGAEIDANGAAISIYFAIKPNTTYHVGTLVGSLPSGYSYCLYSATKGILSCGALSNDTTIEANGYAAYLRVSMYNYRQMYLQGSICNNWEREGLKNIADSINNDNIDNGLGSGFFSGFTDNNFGLSSIITIPLNTIQSLTSTSCQILSIPIPFTSSSVPLPCMSAVYEEHIPTIYNLWKIVSFGLIAYFIAIDIFHMVKGFKDPESDKVEVLDL